MGGAIHLGVRKLDGSFETVAAWTNNLNRKALHQRSFLEGDISCLESHLARCRSGQDGYGLVGNDPGKGSYGYVFVDCIARRIIAASTYESVSVVRGISLSIERLMGTPESKEAAAGLLRLIHRRLATDEAELAVGPYSSLDEMISDPDFANENIYIVDSPFWTLEDVRPKPDGFAKLRDVVRAATGGLNSGEEVAWARLTGDIQPAADD